MPSQPKTPRAVKAPTLAQATKLRRAGDIDAARRIVGAVLRADQRNAKAWEELARIALAANRADIALEAATKASVLSPTSSDALALRARALTALQRSEEALAAWDRLAVLTPGDIAPNAEKAAILQKLGRFEEAGVILRKLLERAPKDGVLYRLLSDGQKMGADDPAIPAMQAAWADRRIKGRDRAHLGFALAKTMSDIGRHDRVFTYLNPANAELRRLFPDDPKARATQLARLRAAYDGVDFTRPIGPAHDGFRPIFVTGLPRSGTTLVEEILGRHSKVTAAGEVPGRLDQVEALLSTPKGGLRRPDAVSAADYAAFAKTYEAQLRARLSFQTHVTDKGLAAPLILGPLALALPQARFVVVRRDPRDIGLSIYRNLFDEGGHRYSTDLKAIAQRIRDFERMLDFWQERMGDRIHCVRYEDLVSDPEAGARALVAAAGLDWEDACLDPGASTGTVGTLSVHQVRQPIYTTSKQGWQRYASDLAPLIDALGLKEEMP